MITYPQFTFASAPRTASTWFIKVCADVGLGEAQKAHVHVPPPPDWDVGSMLMVTMIRHPYHWLISYYTALQAGATGIDVVDHRFLKIAREASDVNRFVRLYLKRQPGAVGAMFDDYKATSVFRIEDLPWCVVEFLSSLEKEAVFASYLPPMNAYNGTPPRPNPKLRAAVVAAEHEFCQRYEYY